MAGSLLPWVSADDLRLLRLLAAPEAEVPALWRGWQAAVDLDALPWSSVRLAAAAIGRLGRLGRQEAFGPRLLGVRRYCWSNGQHKLAAAGPALDALVGAGIPLLLLKGGAALAAGEAAPGERYIADIDLLLPPDRCDEALDLLAGLGWRPQSGGRMARVKGREMARHHAVNLVDGGQGEIDLHWCLLKENRVAGDDAAIWAAAEPVAFVGRALLIPAPEDRLLQALAQGVQWSSGNALDWAADAIALLRRPALDCDRLLAAVAARRLAAQVGLALRFLAAEVGSSLPLPLAALAGARPPMPWRGELAAGLLPTDLRGRNERRVLAGAAAVRLAAARRQGRASLFAARLQEARLPLPGLIRHFPRRRLALEVLPLPAGGARLRLPPGATAGGFGRILLALAAERDRPGLCRIELASERDWVARWRVPRGRTLWRGARLSAAALAALAGEGLFVESHSELRRVAGEATLEARDDGAVAVTRAIITS